MLLNASGYPNLFLLLLLLAYFRLFSEKGLLPFRKFPQTCKKWQTAQTLFSDFLTL